MLFADIKTVILDCDKKKTMWGFFCYYAWKTLSMDTSNPTEESYSFLDVI